MTRFTIARRLIAGAFLFVASVSAVLASGQGVTLYDQRDNALGTAINPLNVTGGGPSALPPNAAQETGGNLAAIAARTPPLGQATKAQSQPVVLPSDQGPLTVSPNACTTTQTIVTGTGGTLIAANPNRKSLRWMNVGASDVTVSPGTAAPVVGQGMIYASTAAGKQGGGETYPDAAVASNAFAYAASASATVAVWECQ